MMSSSQWHCSSRSRCTKLQAPVLALRAFTCHDCLPLFFLLTILFVPVFSCGGRHMWLMVLVIQRRQQWRVCVLSAFGGIGLPTGVCVYGPSRAIPPPGVRPCTGGRDRVQEKLCPLTPQKITIRPCGHYRVARGRRPSRGDRRRKLDTASQGRVPAGYESQSTETNANGVGKPLAM